jgi:hypothetical protein
MGSYTHVYTRQYALIIGPCSLTALFPSMSLADVADHIPMVQWLTSNSRHTFPSTQPAHVDRLWRCASTGSPHWSALLLRPVVALRAKMLVGVKIVP